MEIGVSLKLENIGQFERMSGYDFIELSDFCFSQFLCQDEFMSNFHSIMALGKYRVKCIQGPIRDIKPEADDPSILEITKIRFKHLIELAANYGAKYVLFNTTFDPLVRFDFYTNMWIKNNKRFWEEIIPFAEKNKVVCLYSNVWDDAPYLLNELFNHINSEYFKFGFDIGHMNYITRVPMGEWFKVLGNFIKYVLIHDNCGQRDEHLSIGRGTIDFDRVFEQLKCFHKMPDLCIQLFDENRYQECVEKLIDLLNRHNIRV